MNNILFQDNTFHYFLGSVVLDAEVRDEIRQSRYRIYRKNRNQRNEI